MMCLAVAGEDEEGEAELARRGPSETLTDTELSVDLGGSTQWTV